MAEWEFAGIRRAESLCQVQHFGFRKNGGNPAVEFIITVREYGNPRDPGKRFFAQADKAVNQHTAPFTPVGWGTNLSGALFECIQAIRSFPYEPTYAARL